MQSDNQPDPAKLHPLLLFFAWGSLALIAIIFFHQWFSGNHVQWPNGSIKSCDLSQHYAAGELWNKGEPSLIYQDHHLGDHMNEWSKSLHNSSDKSIQNFNYVYSPLLGWISSMLVSLNYGYWTNAWLLLTLTSQAASLVLLKKCYPELLDLRIAAWPLWFGFPSLLYILIPGQNSTMTLFLISFSAFYLHLNMQFLAGFILGCAFYKPQFMPLIAWVFLIAGHWKFSLGIVSSSLFFLLLGIMICGWEMHLLWFDSLRAMSSGEQFQRDELNQSIRGMFLTLNLPFDRSAIDLFCYALGFVLLTGLGVLSRKTIHPSTLLLLAASLLLIVSPYAPHYEIILGAPLWMICFARHRKSNSVIALTIFFWIISLLSIQGLASGLSLTAPFLALWFMLSFIFLCSSEQTNITPKY